MSNFLILVHLSNTEYGTIRHLLICKLGKYPESSRNLAAACPVTRNSEASFTFSHNSQQKMSLSNVEHVILVGLLPIANPACSSNSNQAHLDPFGERRRGKILNNHTTCPVPLLGRTLSRNIRRRSHRPLYSTTSWGRECEGNTSAGGMASGSGPPKSDPASALNSVATFIFERRASQENRSAGRCKLSAR